MQRNAKKRHNVTIIQMTVLPWYVCHRKSCVFIFLILENVVEVAIQQCARGAEYHHPQNNLFDRHLLPVCSGSELGRDRGAPVRSTTQADARTFWRSLVFASLYVLPCPASADAALSFF